VTIRDFGEDETGLAVPKYEAKFVGSIDRNYVEEELVLSRRSARGAASASTSFRRRFSSA
jgi:hypothetical protein